MANESNNTVYVLFMKDYHPYFLGVFSSERAACEYALNDSAFGSYFIKAIDVDTNEKREVSEDAKGFLHWLDRESFDECLFDHMSEAEAMRITELRAQAKLYETFGE